MLTPQALACTSSAYRRGYRDGAEGAPRVTYPAADWSFAPLDYAEGYKAGANDAHWARQRSKPSK